MLLQSMTRTVPGLSQLLDQRGPHRHRRELLAKPSVVAPPTRMSFCTAGAPRLSSSHKSKESLAPLQTFLHPGGESYHARHSWVAPVISCQS